MTNAPTPMFYLQVDFILRKPWLSFYKADRESYGSPLVFLIALSPESLRSLSKFLLDFISEPRVSSLKLSSGDAFRSVVLLIVELLDKRIRL